MTKIICANVYKALKTLCVSSQYYCGNYERKLVHTERDEQLISVQVNICCVVLYCIVSSVDGS